MLAIVFIEIYHKTVFTSAKGGYVFGRVGLFVHMIAYKLICMKLVPEVCLDLATEQFIKFWG